MGCWWCASTLKTVECFLQKIFIFKLVLTITVVSLLTLLAAAAVCTMFCTYCIACFRVYCSKKTHWVSFITDQSHTCTACFKHCPYYTSAYTGSTEKKQTFCWRLHNKSRNPIWFCELSGYQCFPKSLEVLKRNRHCVFTRVQRQTDSGDTDKGV